MSIERFNTTVRRTLLTASAMTVLLALPAFAQNQPRESAASAAERNTFRGSTVAGPAEPNKEKAVIQRSFENRVDLNKVTNVKAGTNATYDLPVRSQVESRPDSAPADRDSVSRDLANLPEGAGVIIKDGKVVARAREEESSGRDTQVQTPRASQTRKSGGPQKKYKSLTGMTVVNSTGQTIGSVEDVVINNENGETSLLVATENMTGTGTVRVLAPIREVAIIGSDAVWDTLKTPGELTQSEDDYGQISDNSATRDSRRDQGTRRQ